MSFNANVFVSEQLNRLMVNAAQELAQRAVSACAEQYNFDAEEAIRLLGLRNVKLERKVLKSEKKAKVVMPKPRFPLPYNGEINENLCYALRQNSGLYTQCSGSRKVKGSPDGLDCKFCKSCVKVMQKTGENIPEYGTIQARQAVGIFEYVDPKGRKPVAYTKIMKKYKLTQEEVLEEAGKFNININANHFITPEEEKKRGRRAKTTEESSSALKEGKVKGTKGRPKKEKKVIQIEGDDDDLFAALIEEANSVEESTNKKGKVDEVDEDKTAKKKAEEEAKAAKKKAEEEEKAAKKEQERLEREAKKKAEEEEKAAKAAKKEQERLEREAKKKAEEEEKAAKAAKKEQERLEREAKKKAEEEAKAAKASKASKKENKKQEEEEQEEDVVKKIEYNGSKYFKSKKTGIIYDYNKLKSEGEQVKLGIWNEATNKIDFDEDSDSDEESEDEYEE